MLRSARYFDLPLRRAAAPPPHRKIIVHIVRAQPALQPLTCGRGATPHPGQRPNGRCPVGRKGSVRTENAVHRCIIGLGAQCPSSSCALSAQCITVHGLGHALSAQCMQVSLFESAYTTVRFALCVAWLLSKRGGYPRLPRSHPFRGAPVVRSSAQPTHSLLCLILHRCVRIRTSFLLS